MMDNPDDILKNEARFFEVTPTELAVKKISDAAPVAADTLIDLMLTGSENVKLKSATYVLDRLVGKDKIETGAVDPMETLVRQLSDN